MITIRKGVFETNSSSTHTVTIVPDDGNTYYIDRDDILLTKEERNISILYIIEEIHGKDSQLYKDFLENPDMDISEYEEIMKENYYDYPITLDEYMRGEYGKYYEYDSVNYTTKSGDKIIVICKYGENY